MQPDALINELLATGTMNEDTTAQLNTMLDDYRAGTLDPDDEEYLRALHARITSTQATEKGPAPGTAPAPVTEPERLDGHTLEEWRDRALRAEAALADLEDQETSGPN
ncbi:hypothetical protein [Devosia sp.]|uniref:hypothetical protein n=1 Tax=Devosia sp. TaxID=1871048 RepID=UPI003A94D31F